MLLKFSSLGGRKRQLYFVCAYCILLSSMGDTTTSRINVEEEVSKVLEQVKELEDSAASFISKASIEEKALCQRAISLDSTIKRLRSLTVSLIDNKALDSSLADKLDEKLHKAKCIMADGVGASFLPVNSQGCFLMKFIGPINVRAPRKEIQFKVKEEYNRYRDRTTLLFLLFPSTLLILGSCFWNGCLPAFPVQLYQAWLFFLYLSLALRENILKANGSDIRPWWIYHHYCAMIMALVSLTWDIKGEEDCIQKQRGVQFFLQWAIMQGVAMFLQNRYQRQRLYTRIALGKANRMDVVWGEAAGVDGQLLVLCPILFTIQGIEAYIGVMLLRTRTTSGGVAFEWQLLFCGMLLVVMAVGNFINTVQTLMAKSRVKARAKRSKGKQ